MKECKPNLKWNKKLLPYYVTKFSNIVMIVSLLIIMSCTNLESDLSVEPSDPGTEVNSDSSVARNIPITEKCVSIGQEITDRNIAYSKAFIAKDLDLLYNNFWTVDHHEFNPNYDKDREGMFERMTWYYANGGTVDSYDLQTLERYVYNNAVYDFGAVDNVNHFNGIEYIINGYYFLRWIKGHDGVWRVDKSVAGSRGNTNKVIPTTDEGPVICHNKNKFKNQPGEEAASQEISDRFAAYREALAQGDVNALSKFWTLDIHLYGEGLDVNRDGLYDYYTNLFKTGSIVSSDIKLHARFVHDDVAYDIGQSENIEVINGVQSVKKTNYAIRWQKGRDGVWRINRIMDLLRL
jgi:ketosteroid isomerase-like protein